MGSHLALKIPSSCNRNNCFSICGKPAIHLYAISLKHNWGCAFGPEHVVSLNTIKKRLGLIMKDYYNKVSTQGKTNWFILAKLKTFTSNEGFSNFQLKDCSLLGATHFSEALKLPHCITLSLKTCFRSFLHPI